MFCHGRESHKQYYLPTEEIKDYNVMIDGRNFFDQLIKYDLKTYNKWERLQQDKDMTILLDIC